LFSCGFLSTSLITPAVSAERISFTYGVFGEFYISITDLETFAKEGKITPSLAYYADRFSKQDLARLRDLLNRSFKINQVTASIFLNLPIGRQVTKEIGLIIDSPAKVSQPALRASLILAAAKPEGLTILNVLRLYSTKTLRLNTSRIAEGVNEATKLLAQTEKIFQALAQEAKTQKARRTIDVDNLANLSGFGGRKWRRKHLNIKSDNRVIDGVVYLPISSKKPAPLVVIAPGLNTNWQNFSYIAKHLASHGFGVAAVNFPATNARRLKAVLNGTDTPPEDNEWVEQPKVITQLLDEIEDRSRRDRSWQKLDLRRVGIMGQSLGGYTAMAIAGAEVDWQNLQQECQKQDSSDKINFNPALLWQCLGAKTSIADSNLQDERIVAAIAINPVTNPIFSEAGMSQLDLPLMMITGNVDLFAPALDGQLKPFTWLPNSNKYLVLIENSTHFSFIGGISEIQSAQIESHFPLSSSYLKVLSVAFFKAHLAQQVEFKPYLTEFYMEKISEPILPMNLLRLLNTRQLKD